MSLVIPVRVLRLLTYGSVNVLFLSQNEKFYLMVDERLIQLSFWMNDYVILQKLCYVLSQSQSIPLAPEQIYLFFTGDLFAYRCFANQYAAVSSMLEVADRIPMPVNIIDMSQGIFQEYGSVLDPFMWVRAGLVPRNNWPELTGQVTQEVKKSFYRKISEEDELILSFSSVVIQKFAIEHQLFQIIDLEDFQTFTLREKVALAYIIARVKEFARRNESAENLSALCLSEIDEATLAACNHLWKGAAIFRFLNRGLKSKFTQVVRQYFQP